MPTYVFECPDCLERRSVFLPMSKRDTPQYCQHELPYDGVSPNGIYQVEVIPMRRIFTSFQFCAQMEKDKPENQVLRILSGSSSRSDWKEVERQQEQYCAESMAAAEKEKEDSRYVPMSEIDIQGAWTAAHAGTDQLIRWRQDNIKPIEWTPEEMAEAEATSA